MAKNKRRANKAETEEIKEIETLEETVEEIVESPEDAAEESVGEITAEEVEEIDEEIVAENEAEESDEEVEAEDEAEESDEEVEAEDEAEESDDEVEEGDEAEESYEEIEEEDEAEESDEEVEAEDEAEESDEEVEEEDEAEEIDEEVEEEDEAEEIDEEIEAENEAEEIDEEVEEENKAEESDKEIEEEDKAEESDEEVEEEDEAEEIDENFLNEDEDFDEDDYLDYDDDENRPKKIVSGKVATVTMLLTFCLSILAVVGAFLFASKFQRSMSVDFVSYTDRFNSCRTNDFSYGSMLGIDTVSYSDEECTLTEKDIKDLKSGKTVTKFNGLVNIAANVRFGKLVSMDITFNPEIDDTENPSGYYTLLAGNVISGLVADIDTSDYGFMLAYTVLSYSMPVEGRDNVYVYQFDDMNFYVDYSKAMETESVKDISIHVENAEPHYIDTSSIDTSWLPWNREAVSDSDVSATDN